MAGSLATTAVCHPKQGSDQAASFESFFVANYGTLLHVMVLSTGDLQEAEDIVQEAFVKTLERWDRIRAMDNRAGYLYRIAANAHKSRLRKASLAAARAVSSGQPDPISETDDRDVLRRVLATIPDSQRTDPLDSWLRGPIWSWKRIALVNALRDALALEYR